MMTKIPDPNPYPWKKEYEVNHEMYDQQILYLSGFRSI